MHCKLCSIEFADDGYKLCNHCRNLSAEDRKKNVRPLPCKLCKGQVEWERSDRGYSTCKTCAEKHTQTPKVTQMGYTTEYTVEYVPPDQMDYPIKIVHHGRFRVTTLIPVEWAEPGVWVKDNGQTACFDLLTDAMEYAKTLPRPTVRDTTPDGLGQVYPSPDRMFKTYTRKPSRY